MKDRTYYDEEIELERNEFLQSIRNELRGISISLAVIASASVCALVLALVAIGS
jgi:hypothetical protein